MTTLCVSEESLDDLLQVTLKHLLIEGNLIHPSKGDALEEIGARLELRNPYARVSRSHKRGRIFSALGELLWYMSGSDEVDFISYYISAYPNFAVDGRIEGAYGPRLFGSLHRLDDVVELLKSKPDSRRAVVQIFDHADIGNEKDVPCTTNLQFLLRDGQLYLVAHMRSNDAYVGLPHDIFAFTMIQEYVARQLGASLGTYTHFVGSVHLYVRDRDGAERFLNEGWQQTTAMPAMPVGDPRPEVAKLLEAEVLIRTNSTGAPTLGQLGSTYWDDLIRLLLARRSQSAEELSVIRDSVSHEFFKVYMTDRLPQLAETNER